MRLGKSTWWLIDLSLLHSLPFAVSPVVEPFSFSSDLVSGRRAGVACVVSAGDLPIKIKWLKDGQPLDNSLGGTVSTADFTSFLSFSRVSRVHNGNYTCLAENPAASASYSAPMIVQGKCICVCVCSRSQSCSSSALVSSHWVMNGIFSLCLEPNDWESAGNHCHYSTVTSTACAIYNGSLVSTHLPIFLSPLHLQNRPGGPSSRKTSQSSWVTQSSLMQELKLFQSPSYGGSDQSVIKLFSPVNFSSLSTDESPFEPLIIFLLFVSFSFYFYCYFYL